MNVSLNVTCVMHAMYVCMYVMYVFVHVCMVCMCVTMYACNVHNSCNECSVRMCVMLSYVMYLMLCTHSMYVC